MSQGFRMMGSPLEFKPPFGSPFDRLFLHMFSPMTLDLGRYHLGADGIPRFYPRLNLDYLFSTDGRMSR